MYFNLATVLAITTSVLVAQPALAIANRVVAREDNNIHIKCPQTIHDDNTGTYNLVEEANVNSGGEILECYYTNNKDKDRQTYCTYRYTDGHILSDGDGFCPRSLRLCDEE